MMFCGCGNSAIARIFSPSDVYPAGRHPVPAEVDLLPSESKLRRVQRDASVIAAADDIDDVSQVLAIRDVVCQYVVHDLRCARDIAQCFVPAAKILVSGDCETHGGSEKLHSPPGCHEAGEILAALSYFHLKIAHLGVECGEPSLSRRHVGDDALSRPGRVCRSLDVGVSGRSRLTPEPRNRTAAAAGQMVGDSMRGPAGTAWPARMAAAVICPPLV